MTLTDKQQATLDNAFNLIVAHNLAAPSVFVHRDFMTRNLMVPLQEGGPLAVLDFQDAVYGPITYDIASLLRDAFISWEEEFVIDVTVRYWGKPARPGCWGQQRQRLGCGLWRVLPRGGMDGPAAPPEGGGHFCPPRPCATTSPVPGRRPRFCITSTPPPTATASWARCCNWWMRSKAPRPSPVSRTAVCEAVLLVLSQIGLQRLLRKRWRL